MSRRLTKDDENGSILRQAQDERRYLAISLTVHPELVEGWIEGFSDKPAMSTRLQLNRNLFIVDRKVIVMRAI